MIMSKELESIKKKVIPILKKHNATRAGIFGSYARGDFKKNSDVDILVEVDNNIGLLDFIGIKLELEKKLKKKVDLVEYSLIREEIKNSVLNNEVPIIR